MTQHMQAARVLSHAVLLEPAEVALQGSKCFNGQVMEELMHEVLPEGGNFRIR